MDTGYADDWVAAKSLGMARALSHHAGKERNGVETSSESFPNRQKSALSLMGWRESITVSQSHGKPHDTGSRFSCGICIYVTFLPIMIAGQFPNF